MEALGGLIAGSIVVVALAAFKLVERITNKRGNGRGTDLSSDVKSAIFNVDRRVAALLQQHAPEGGVERWKWPGELTGIIQSIGETQRTQVRLMEAWDVNLEKHREREEIGLTEIRDALRDLLVELK